MQLFINNWSAALTASATASAVSLSVDAAQAALLVGLGSGDHYVLTLAEISATGEELRREIVRCTAAAGGSLTVTRAQEGTTAQVWDVGTVIEARLTKETMETLQASGAVTPSDAAPLPLGAAPAPGTSGELSRADHVHQRPAPADIGAATAAQGAKADTAIQASEKGAASGVATLGSDSKIPLAQLPATAITSTFVVNTEAAMLALSAQEGDVAVRPDISTSFILKVEPASTLANWQELLSPAAGGGAPVGSDTPQPLGTATPGVSASSSRQDHVHAMPGAADIGAAPAGHVGAGGTAHASAVADGAAGFMTGADKAKLDGVAPGATANSSDAALLDRANHTGEQAISTVTGLQAVLDAKAAIAGLPSRTITASGPVTPADAGHWLICNSATPITLTIGAEATASWAIAGILPMFRILQIGAGAVTVAGDGFSVTLPEGATNVISELGFAVSLVRRGANVWSLIGAGELGATEWSAETVLQAEAEAGTATTRRAWTAERVRQAIVAWWNSVSSAWGRGFVSSADAAAGRTALSVREQLTADRKYFVRTNGSDSNSGLSNTAGGAFLTIQRAVDTASSLDLGIFNCTIQVADGTYEGAVVLKAFVGSGQIRIIGNETTPANVIITGGGNLISGTDFGRYLIAGVTIASTGLRNIQVSGRGQLQYRNIVSQGAAGLNTHIAANSGAEVQAIGQIVLNGNSQLGFVAMSYGFMNIRGQTITFSPGTTLPSRAFQASDQGRVDMISMTFNGTFTGKRYEATGLGAIFTNNAGENYIPGSIAGTTATGGLYY